MAPSHPDPALADPFFGSLRLAHPDVDIVLLPPLEAAPPDLPAERPASEGQCRAIRHHAQAVLDLLVDRLGRPVEDQLGYWRQQRHPLVHRWVLSALFAHLGTGQGIALLRRLGNTLLELGWDTRPAADGSPRLRGVAGPIELVATAYDDRVSVTLTSDPLHVTAEILRAAEATA